MKHKFFALLIIIGFVQNTQILSSCKNGHKLLQQKENPKKVLKIARFLINGLTFVQAHHAYQLKFNLQQALTVAQNNELKTLESYFKKKKENGTYSQDDAWFEQDSSNREKNETKRYLETASLIKKDQAQTIIAAHFRSYQARHNIKTGK